MYPAPEGTALFEHLGAGSVFDVALVQHGGRLLVCKRLNSRALREPAGRAALVREARVLSLVRHPALPELTRVGSDGHGPFILQTRQPGVSIRSVLEGWQARGRRPPRALVNHVVRTALEVLAEIQALCRVDGGGPLGLIHGDITPDHVLLGPIGDVRFVDLGAARFEGMPADLATDDRGTLPFVAPEVARGESAPTQAADLYSLAAALAWFTTGEALTRAREEAAALAEIGEHGLLLDPLKDDTTLAAGARDVLLRALARDPDERPCARALLDALDDEGNER
ncbi:protein kinase domain-containing protein [Chondromyces crocatus]|uniref:Protein kinase n=1 Tax=Chondromyces crocatus TaxID=52 RepID=A0A0K1EC34_CHOCO|nr:protein kinase [Chondromyces crocatus]AKT38446.1 protein kinase [Chondromyces crocatus]